MNPQRRRSPSRVSGRAPGRIQHRHRYSRCSACRRQSCLTFWLEKGRTGLDTMVQHLRRLSGVARATERVFRGVVGFQSVPGGADGLGFSDDVPSCLLTMTYRPVCPRHRVEANSPASLPCRPRITPPSMSVGCAPRRQAGCGRLRPPELGSSRALLVRGKWYTATGWFVERGTYLTLAIQVWIVLPRSSDYLRGRNVGHFHPRP